MIDCPNCGKQLMPDSSNPMRMKCTYCNYVLDPTADMDPLPGLFANESPAYSAGSGVANPNAATGMDAVPPQGSPVIPAAEAPVSSASASEPLGSVPSLAQAQAQTQATSEPTPTPTSHSYYQPPQGSPVVPPTGTAAVPPQGGGTVPPQTMQSAMPTGSVPPKLSKGLAIASMVLGILALLNCWIPFISIGAIIMGVLALIFGIVALVQFTNGKAGGKGLSITGVVCGGIALLVSIIVTVASFVAFMTFIDDYSSYTYDDRYTYRYDEGIPKDWDSEKYREFMDQLDSQTGGMNFSDDAAWVNMSFTLDGKSYTLLSTSFDTFQERSGWKIDLEEAGYPYGYIVQPDEEVVSVPLTNEAYPDTLMLVDVYNPGKDQCDLEKCQLSGIWLIDETLTISLELPGGIKIDSSVAEAKAAYGEPFLEYNDTEENIRSLSYFTSDLYKSLDLLTASDSERINGIYLTFIFDE